MRALVLGFTCILLGLQGCASAPEVPVTGFDPQHPHALFAPRPAIPDLQQLFALTPAQQAALDAFLALAPEQARHQRVADYLERLTRHFNYQEATYTAREALEQQRGNCLSLAILTTALARHAGVVIHYQLMSDAPVYQVGGRAVLKGVHVRSRLTDPVLQAGSEAPLRARPGVIVDYFPSGKERFIGNLDTAAFIASYYHNRAAEFLQEDRLDEAWWYAQEAFSHAPTDADSINLLAVIGRRAGAVAYAERLYRHGIASAGNKLSLLKNYRALLLAEGRTEEAREVEQTLSRMDDPSPFHWFLLAQDALREGDVEAALGHYRRALALAPYLHEARLGMAQASYQAGRLTEAREHLLQALGTVQRNSTRQSYKAKLLSLERELTGLH